MASDHPSGVSEPLFDAGSTVYIPYEGGTHYQARVVKREIREHQHFDGTKAPMWFYLVHYMGWNKKYDEWVEEIGCAADPPEKMNIPNKSKSKPKGAPIQAGKAHTDLGKPQISMAIPGALKQQLIKDHDAVKEGKNIPMPRSPCVCTILERYKANARERAKGTTPDVEEQVANGLRSYFDKTLAVLLLYHEERVQADALLKGGDVPSSIYGAEHLMRLFLKLPELLPVESSTEEQYRFLQASLHEILEFLQEHYSEFFLPTSEYVTVS